MKKWAAVVAGIIIAIAIWFFVSHNKTAPSAPSQKTTEQQNAAVATALANQNTNTVAVIESNFARVQSPQAMLPSAVARAIPPAGMASPLEFSNIPPETVVQNVSRTIRQYGEMFGGNPVGTNPEFTRKLSGDNPKHINFISEEAGMRVNEKGELVDPWGTPYFFHQISGADTEVRSAGPDKTMYTSDDIVEP